MPSKTYPRVTEMLASDIKNGESLRGIVRKTGLNSNTIANYLEGITEPTAESLKKLSDAYRLPVAYLRGDSDDVKDRLFNKTSAELTFEESQWLDCFNSLMQQPEEKRKLALSVFQSVVKGL